MNSLAITEFDPHRHSEFKSRCIDLFLLLEIEAWQSESSIEGYVPLAATASLPYPNLPFNKSAFTYTNQHLNTHGHSLQVAFIKTFPSPNLTSEPLLLLISITSHHSYTITIQLH